MHASTASLELWGFPKRHVVFGGARGIGYPKYIYAVYNGAHQRVATISSVTPRIGGGATTPNFFDLLCLRLPRPPSKTYLRVFEIENTLVCPCLIPTLFWWKIASTDCSHRRQSCSSLLSRNWTKNDFAPSLLGCPRTLLFSAFLWSPSSSRVFV